MCQTVPLNVDSSNGEAVQRVAAHAHRTATTAVGMSARCWRRMSQSGQRTCWGRKRFDMSLFQTLPVVIKEKYHSLRLSLQRNRRR